MFIYIDIYRKGVFLFALIYMYNLALVDLQLKKNKTDIIYIYIYVSYECDGNPLIIFIVTM